MCVCVLEGHAGGGGLVSDRDLSAPQHTHTHTYSPPFVWMVEHSPESNAGQAGISVQICRDSSISLDVLRPLPGSSSSSLQTCDCSQNDAT